MESYALTILQSLSSALLLLCLWLAKRLYDRVDKLEGDHNDEKLRTEREISKLRLDTTTKCLELERKLREEIRAEFK